MDISLIICTKDRSDYIKTVLECATSQTLSKELYEILVIDQSDDNQTKNIAEEFERVSYYKIAPEGLSNSRNKSIDLSNGKILVYVDDDVEFEQDYLDNILVFFNNSPLQPDFCGGKTHLKLLTEKPEWIKEQFLGILAYSDYGNEPKIYDNHPKHVPYGCNMAVKRDALIKAGGFPAEIYYINNCLTENEDVLLANKLRSLGGHVVYNPDMLVYHRIPASRLTYTYYKERYLSQGESDAYIYYLLGHFNKKDLPALIIKHLVRIIESLPKRFTAKDSFGKKYQQIRLHYNAGYIRALASILTGKVKKNYK